MNIVWPHAAVLHANYASLTEQLGPHGPVESRMLLWCKRGHGYAVVNDKKYALTEGLFYFLPWRRTITYVPEGRRPLLLGGVHIIPDHAHNAPLVLEIAHDRRHRLFGVSSRVDAVFPGVDNVFFGTLVPHPAFTHAIEYTASCWRRDLDAVHVRSLARIIVRELLQVMRNTGGGEVLPKAIMSICEQVKRDPAGDYSVDGFCETSGMSRSTLCRLFKKHYGMSPMEFVIRERIERAAVLLTTTSLPIADAGEESGIADQYYFSKLFKRMKGMTPRAYRETMHM
ncbi:MAG: helix-turn-helix transcriptional regulator [Spirochaetes bacterium]|nr:helix-turn-helix transcriptional regulator [Spirochaetota bacterium]